MLEKKSGFVFCDAHFHLVRCADFQNLSDMTAAFSGDDVFFGCTCAHDRKEYETQKKMCAQFSSCKNIRLMKAFGMHPQLPLVENADFLEKLLSDGELDAVGEAGFDVYTQEFRENSPAQEEAWRIQIALAAEYGKPLVVHCRKALQRIFRDSALLQKIHAVLFHSFCGGMHEAEGILGKGINAYFSFCKQIIGGNKKSMDCVKNLPSGRLLLETDAPFQTLKGEQFTSPSEIRRVYQAAYTLRREKEPLLTENEFSAALQRNFQNVFGLP